MDRSGLLSRIAPFPLQINRLSADLLSGNYRSVFRGQGIEFDEVRRYEAEDDARSIDWNVSARFGVPYVKLYREEREITVCLVLDSSASMFTRGVSAESSPAGVCTLYEQGLLAAALIAYSAEHSGQRFCGLFFDDRVRRIIPARKGKSHVMAFITAALENRPLEKGTGLGPALTCAGSLLKRRSLVVVISDYYSLGWEKEMRELSGKHDVIAIRISCPLEHEIPCNGFLTLEDPETGVNIRSPVFPDFQTAWKTWHQERQQVLEAIIRRSGAAFLDISAADDAASVLAGFFRRKRNRMPG